MFGIKRLFSFNRTTRAMMIDLRGRQEWLGFQKDGDLGPLMKVMKAGALSPAVQQMIAIDAEAQRKGTFYLSASRARGEYGRIDRLLAAGQQISEWLEQGRQLKWALGMATEQKLISNDTQGKEALQIYNEAMEFLRQQAAEEGE